LTVADKPKWYELKKKNKLANELTGGLCKMPFVKNGKRGKCGKRKGHKGDHG
jgi:hypothetical protein